MIPATIIVAGLARCGTSMVMQMLAAGGVPCVGRAPAYEDRAVALHVTADYIARHAGRAIKVLDPQRTGLPGNVRVIWLDRDHREQARSHAKFMRLLMGLDDDRASRRKLERSLIRDTHAAMATIGARPLLRLEFETVLERPLPSAEDIGRFIRVPFDVTEAALAVRDRSPKCAPGFELELALTEDVREGEDG